MCLGAKWTVCDQTTGEGMWGGVGWGGWVESGYAAEEPKKKAGDITNV